MKKIVEIPQSLDSRKKTWRKLLKSVDLTQKTGYAFNGDWLKAGEKDELSIGDHIMAYDEEGSMKNWYPVVRLFRVEESGLNEVFSWDGSTGQRSWALDVRNKIHQIINEKTKEKPVNTTNTTNTMITQENYPQHQELVNSIVKGNEIMEKSKSLYDRGKHLYGKNEGMTRAIDLYIDRLNQLAAKQGKTPQPKADKPAAKPEAKAEVKKETPATQPKAKEAEAKKETAKKPTAPKKTKAPRTTKAPAKRTGKFHRNLPVEITYIRRFVGMDGKSVTKQSLRNFLSKISSDNAKGLFSVKSGNFGKEVNHIVDELDRIVKSNAGSEFVFKLDAKDKAILNKFTVALEQNKQDPSVALIVRFNNLYRNANKEKAERLLTSVNNAFKKGRVIEKDAFYSDLKTVQSALKTYVSRGGQLKIPAGDLRGLQGIADCCGGGNWDEDAPIYEQMKALVEKHLGKPAKQTSSSDWGGADVWPVTSDGIFEGEFVIIGDDDEVVHLIRQWDSENEQYNDKVIQTADSHNAINKMLQSIKKGSGLGKLPGSIKTVADVKTFFRHLTSEGVNFHPDNPFEDYIHIETKKPTFTKAEAAKRNKLMQQAFAVCDRQGEDIYGIAIDISNENGGLGALPLVPFATSTAAIYSANKLLQAEKKFSDLPARQPAPQIVSSEALQQMNFKTIELDEPFRSLIGNPSPNFKMLVFGLPKHGKSSFAIMFANHLAKFHGNVLFVGIEEKFGYTLAEKFQRLNASHPALDIAERLPDNISKYQHVVIDSISRANMTVEDVISLFEKHPDKSFTLVTHSTKDGSHRGSQELLHEVDISVDVHQGEATASGRFAPAGYMKVIEWEGEANAPVSEPVSESPNPGTDSPNKLIL